jgi:tRNA-Thr(GGU) m(6)t(6)A37 methyltransferase TsaA
MNEKKSYTLNPIGHVLRDDDGVHIEIDEAFRPALAQLEHFSHVIVLWWADRLDDEEYRKILQTHPPYAGDRATGVFATRAEYRPNPIALTTCPLLGVDEEAGRLHVANIDAVDGTPVVDLKAYFPVCDRVREASIPEWLEGWPEWMPTEGLEPEIYEAD